MSYMQVIGKRAKEAKKSIAYLSQEEKTAALLAVADALEEKEAEIMAGNRLDVEAAKAAGMKSSLIDRMYLDEARIAAMAEGLREISLLEDPVGAFDEVKVRPNGLRIGKKRVPLGVVGIIYESRPNVTADAFGLCFKTNNVAVLRGSSDAINSNKAITSAIKLGLDRCKISQDGIILVEDTSYEVADEMMKLNEYLDVLIPRGGAGLINRVVENSTVPTIETGTGNCHVFVDRFADQEMAVNIIENAKTQRLGVCNACESLVIDREIASQVLPKVVARLAGHGIEIRGDEEARKISPELVKATADDWGSEYLDGIISVKIVGDVHEGIAHINEYNTGHSETIVTNHLEHADLFQERVDAAAVYVNASTRFTDGCEFGYGAEIGISTQKLHARGPMGLAALTTTKFVIFGNGQIRK
ncbi:glutamate-5-semialdehyde dehydrogenase [Lachnospiraceae bacterium PF1-22]|uniref:glutamate-5-semialdehyde dehydrogenase n=1 Tax=Ohessyouella blattaphilus TaxID=2949333 RepID=UPI003E1DBF9F